MAFDKASLEKEPCQCVTCHVCGGSGTIRYTIDDFDGPEYCEVCNGCGVEEICGRCQMLEEIDQEEFDES